MRRLAFGPAAFAACVLSAVAAAQQVPPGLPTPRAQNVFPLGLKAGTSVEVAVSGTDLDDPTGLLFAHPGLKGEYLPPKDPPPDPKDPKKTPPPKKVDPNAPHKFKVTAAADVPPGNYDLRFVGKWGVSNPRAFVVGDRPEVAEKEPNNDVPEAQKVELGTVVNGVISAPTDVDYVVFAAKAGQRVVLHAASSSIDTRARPMIEVYAADGRKLAFNRNYRDSDAVADFTAPSDGDYFVRLFEFTYQTGTPDHGYRLTIGTAPWIDAVFPNAVEPGKPAQVTVYGRNLPNGKPADGFTVDGRPLEKATVTVTPPADPQAATRMSFRGRIDPPMGIQDVFEYRLTGPGGVSNPVPVFFAREKLVVQKGANTSWEKAEPMPVPGEAAGFLRHRNDSDWYAITPKKGDVLLIDLFAERTGTEADFFFSVYRPVEPAKDAKPDAPKVQDITGEQDDDPDSLHPFGFYTKTADPAPYKWTAPADGTYYVRVGARESSVLYGPRTGYRLRVAAAKPDFRAVVMPYSRYFQTGSAARQDGSEAYDVFVHRMDGFTGPVTLTAEKLPAGVTAKPVVIGPNVRWGTLALKIAPDAKTFTGPITVKAAGTIDGKPVAREARPATVTWGTPQPNQNVPVLARMDQSLVFAVRPEKGFFKVSADLANAKVKVNNKDEAAKLPLTLKQGEKATIPVKVTWPGADKPNVTLAPEPMMQNANQAPVTAQVGGQPTKDKPEVTVTLDVKPNAYPGVYAVTLRGDSQVPFAKDPMAKQKPNVPAVGFADPIEVTVIPTAVAKVTVTPPPNGVVKLGASADLVVKVERQYDFAGEFKVQFELPKGTAGVTVADATIPAGKDEAKVAVKADAAAKPGGVNNATVKVTATYDGKHAIAHEAKVSFTVAK